MKPIQTFSLVKGTIDQTETHAEISEAAPAWNGARRATPGNTVMHTSHHPGREDYGVPENPVPGKMVGIPTLKCSSNVAREYDVRGIGGNTENDQALRQRRQNKGHGE